MSHLGPGLGLCVHFPSRFPPGRSEGESRPLKPRDAPSERPVGRPPRPPARPPPQAHLGQASLVQIPALVVLTFGRGGWGLFLTGGQRLSMDIWLVMPAGERKEAGTRPSRKFS